jgi:SAM-dependent methyltransferase
MTSRKQSSPVIQRLKRYAESSYDDWLAWETEQFLSLLPRADSELRLLDLGCGDAKFTHQVATKLHIPPKQVLGVDAFDSDEGQIKVVAGNLNHVLPLEAGSFDVVISHFSLEHLYNPAQFLREIFRVLSVDGCAVIGTDNLAAWPNIFSLALGWQPFSSTHGIGINRCGNPLALRSASFMDMEDAIPRGVETPDGWRSTGEFSHNKVLAYLGMLDAYKEAGFIVEEVRGAGYLPLKGRAARIAAKIDIRHAHFLVSRIRKSALID